MTTTGASWVVLARMVRPQGRRGELLADLLTDFPESFAQRKQLFLKPGNDRSNGPDGPDGLDRLDGSREKLREVRVEACWRRKGRVVLKFAGVDSIDDAETLRGFDLVAPFAERMPLSEDEVYVSDLLGVRVIDVGRGAPQGAPQAEREDGGKDAGEIGEIIDVLPAGIGPAMLVVRTEAAEPALIPFVKAYLKRIDLPAKRIEMSLPEGLLAIDAPLSGDRRQRMREEAREDD